MAIPLTLSEVPNVTPYIQYVSGSGQTVFPYPFPITQDSDLIAVVNGVTLNTDSGYTLSGQGNDTGGNLTFTLGQTAGTIVTLFRDIPIERTTQIGQNSGFSSTAFNAEFNNLYLIAQQLEAQIAQCLQIPNTNNPAPVTTLLPGMYANKYLSFDSFGNPQPAVLTSSGSLTAAIINALINGQTAAEAAAGVTPTSLFYLPGNILRYGADASGVSDSTSALQAAVNQSKHGGPATYAPTGTYKISSTITLSAASKITGDGWAAQSGSFGPVAGTIFNWAGTGVFLSLHGVSTGNYAEALTLRDFAIYNSGGNANCVAIQMSFAPFSRLDHLYIAGFTGATGYGIEQSNSSFQCEFSSLKIEGCTTCFYSHDAGEDSLHNNCLYRSFNYTTGRGCFIQDQCQTTHFNNCDLSDNLFGCFIGQGDSVGDGTGIPLPMQITFTSCQFEQNNAAAIGVATSSQSQATKYYPSIFATNCRFFIPSSGGAITPNNGQAILYAQALSQAKFSGVCESGYSYGMILGITQYGFTFSGSAKMGPVIWENDTGYTYGTGRFLAGGGAQNGSITIIPGDHVLSRLTATSLSWGGGGAFTRVPFVTAVSDPYGWAVSANQGWTPLRSQTVRFRAQTVIDAAAAGNYALYLYKNGSAIATLSTITAPTGTPPILLSGEAYDVPNGTDVYWITVYGSVAGALDVATNQTYAVAELMGN